MGAGAHVVCHGCCCCCCSLACRRQRRQCTHTHATSHMIQLINRYWLGARVCCVCECRRPTVCSNIYLEMRIPMCTRRQRRVCCVQLNAHRHTWWLDVRLSGWRRDRILSAQRRRCDWFAVAAAVASGLDSRNGRQQPRVVAACCCRWYDAS